VNPVLQEARKIARALGRRKRYVTADDVYRELIDRGRNPADLGPAAGSIFRDQAWLSTGQWKRSDRVSNHRRKIRIWRYQP
jgi:pentatricopeptide repeat protein